MGEQPLTLRFALRAVSRHRLLLGAVALVGALLGIVYGVERPPLPSATALVLLPSTSSVTQTTSGTATSGLNATQIIIATSTPVLSAAGRAVSPPMGPQALKRDVTVTSVSQDVLQVVVHAPKAGDAVRLANAIASSYVYFVTKAPAPAAENDLAGLQQQADVLTRQIQNLQGQVNAASARLKSESASSPKGRADAELIQTLGDKENQYSLELDNVTNQIATAQLSTGPSAIGTGVLQKAVSAVPPSKLHYVLDGALGMAAGLFLGILIVLIRSRRDHRLRLRDEIAGSIGTPVLGSLHAHARTTTKAWGDLLDKYEPSAVEAWAVRRVLNALPIGRSIGSNLRIVAFVDDEPALAAGAQLAVSVAALGMPTALIPSSHPVLAPLRAASRLHGGGTDHLTLTSGTTDPDEGSLIVSLVPVERNLPQLPPWEGLSLIAVSSGAATAEDLARLTLATADSNDGIAGVVVVNPEPKDLTSGSLPETTTLRRSHVRGRATTGERSHLMEGFSSMKDQR